MFDFVEILETSTGVLIRPLPDPGKKNATETKLTRQYHEL